MCFISHQKKDRDIAKQIVDYLESFNISVYFDEYDLDLQTAERENNPNGVVKAIKKGIQSSTHMICVISPNTLSSKWVPFEVGYGYESTDLRTLTLRGINNSDLPDYIKTKPIIRDINDIDNFIKENIKQTLLEKVAFLEYKDDSHPLRYVMDRLIT